MPNKKTSLLFLSGALLALVFFGIASWIALSFTHLNNFNLLKAHSYGYATVKHQADSAAANKYLQDVGFEIALLACHIAKTEQREAQWFGFRLQGADDLLLQSLKSTGAVDTAADIPAYCQQLPHQVRSGQLAP